MKIEFTTKGWEDFNYWIDADLGTLERVRDLIKDCTRSPFKGIGKPEALKYALKGCWSRRINDEHRLVYSVSGTGPAQTLTILQCRYHY